MPPNRPTRMNPSLKYRCVALNQAPSASCREPPALSVQQKPSLHPSCGLDSEWQTPCHQESTYCIEPFRVARDILSTTRHTVSSFHDDGREAYETATEDAGDMPLSAATLATLSDRLDYLVHDPDMTVESVQVGLINLMMQDDSIASSLGVSQESATEQAYRSSALVRAAMSVGGSLYTHLRRDSAQPRYGTHGAARAEQQSADDTSNAIPSVE